MANKLVFMAFFLILIILMTLQSYSGATKGHKEVNVCAACKHQRHGCPANCIFRRYFPANRPQDFRNFHRLFKVSETKDWFATLSQDQRDDAAKSMKFQSNMRALFPVGGCLQVISTLRYKIALLTDELNLFRTQIANFNPASSCAAAAVFNPAVTGFNPDADVFNPNAATSFNSPATYNPAAATAAAYNPVAAVFNPAVTGFNPDAAVFNPNAAAYNPVAAVFNPPAAVFSSFSAAESSSRNPCTNLTVDDYFTGGVPVGDGTVDFSFGGGHSGNSRDMETRPLERSSVQQFLPNPNNLGSCSAPANNDENAIDSDFADEYEAFSGAPPPNYDNQIQPTNDNQLQFDDSLLTDDWLRSFFQTKESGDKCLESKKKDDKDPFP